MYRDCSPNSTGECSDFRQLWTEDAEFIAFVGDALRHAVKSDLAIVSKDLIDQDYSAYVKRQLQDKSRSSDWISRYVLERVIYDSRRFVRAKVAGSELVSKLQAALKEDGTYCVSGIDGSCPSSVEPKHIGQLAISGRRLNTNLYYSIAMPDHLAESLSLEHSERCYRNGCGRGDASTFSQGRLGCPA
jgi:hypothetical protein